MNVFQFNQNEILTFFLVLVRFGVLLAIFPIFGDRVVPNIVKLLLGLAFTIALFPVLIEQGQISPGEAAIWSATSGGIVMTVLLEMAFAIALGFTARILFDAVQIGGDLIGTFMGLSSANLYDPHQESNTQVVGKLKITIASVLFVSLNAHYILLKAAIESYRFVGIGKVNLSGSFAERLVTISGELIRLGLQFAAPMAIALFTVNIVYGVLSKAIPQLNVLVLSFAVSALVGLFVIFLGMPGFFSLTKGLFDSSGEYLTTAMTALSGK